MRNFSEGECRNKKFVEEDTKFKMYINIEDTKIMKLVYVYQQQLARVNFGKL